MRSLSADGEGAIEGFVMLPALTVLAMDVGGSSVKSALVRGGKVVGNARRTEIPSQTQEPGELLSTFRSIISTYPQAEALAFAFPGPFDYETGVCRVQGVEKFGSLYGLNLSEALSGGLPTRFRNDAEAAIVGEALYGAGRGLKRVLGITLGTGLGSAFLVDGEPVVSEPNVPPRGWLYDQPALGRIADEVFSIRGVRRRAEEAGLGPLQPGEIQDPDLWESFCHDLGRFLAVFAQDFQAEAVLVMGGIAGAFSYFGPALNEQLEDLARPGQLGPNAPLLGAAELFATA